MLARAASRVTPSRARNNVARVSTGHRVLRPAVASVNNVGSVSSEDFSGYGCGSLIPSYLSQTYTWAYLNPNNVALLDNPVIVSAILWGNYHRLVKLATAEFRPGQKVLQTACVYGKFTPELAKVVGPKGTLDIVDVAEVQLENCRSKIADMPWAQARLCDAANPGDSYDSAVSFFLLHEVPDKKKHEIVDAILASVPKSGSKVVFVDYHRTHPLHPLRPIMWGVWSYLEPYAISLAESEIQNFASNPHEFEWQKETYFGGLYQKVIAIRK